MICIEARIYVSLRGEKIIILFSSIIQQEAFLTTTTLQNVLLLLPPQFYNQQLMALEIGVGVFIYQDIILNR
jgi:hypothetical protein